MVWTNLQKVKMFEGWFEASSTAPTTFHVQLATSAAPTNISTAWDATLSSTSEVTLVTAENGYAASGTAIARDGVDIAVSAFGNDGFAEAVLKQLTWTAAGGDIGGSPNQAYYLILTDDNATPTTRALYGFWSLGGNTTITNGQTLTITGGALRGT